MSIIQVGTFAKYVSGSNRITQAVTNTEKARDIVGVAVNSFTSTNINDYTAQQSLSGLPSLEGNSGIIRSFAVDTSLTDSAEVYQSVVVNGVGVNVLYEGSAPVAGGLAYLGNNGRVTSTAGTVIVGRFSGNGFTSNGLNIVSVDIGNYTAIAAVASPASAPASKSAPSFLEEDNGVDESQKQDNKFSTKGVK